MKIQAREIPHSFRNKRLQNKSSVTYLSSGSDASLITPGAGELSKDIIAQVEAGSIKEGDVLLEGTSFSELTKIMFSQKSAELSIANINYSPVEYGSDMFNIIYKLKPNKEGTIKKAFVGGDESNAIEFTKEDTGKYVSIVESPEHYLKDTTHRATVIYTVEGKDEVINNTFDVEVKRRWFAGEAGKVPTTSDEVRALDYSGFWDGSGMGHISMKKCPIFVLCVPGVINEATIDECYYSASLGNITSVMVNGANGSEAIQYSVIQLIDNTPTETEES